MEVKTVLKKIIVLTVLAKHTTPFIFTIPSRIVSR